MNRTIDPESHLDRITTASSDCRRVLTLLPEMIFAEYAGVELEIIPNAAVANPKFYSLTSSSYSTLRLYLQSKPVEVIKPQLQVVIGRRIEYYLPGPLATVVHTILRFHSFWSIPIALFGKTNDPLASLPEFIRMKITQSPSYSERIDALLYLRRIVRRYYPDAQADELLSRISKLELNDLERERVRKWQL